MREDWHLMLNVRTGDRILYHYSKYYYERSEELLPPPTFDFFVALAVLLTIDGSGLSSYGVLFSCTVLRTPPLILVRWPGKNDRW